MRSVLAFGFALVVSAPALALELGETTALVTHPVWESEGGSLRASPALLLQPRFELHIDREVEPWHGGSGMRLRRAEAGIWAELFELATFKLVGALQGGSAEVRDAFVSLDPTGGAATLVVGFFKPPHCRQFLASSGRRQLVEEAEALSVIAPHEELGAQLGGLLGGVVEYAAGVWFAADDAFAANTGSTTDPIAGGRLVVHPLGYVPVKGVPDLQRSAKPGLAVGASAMFERRTERVVALAELGEVSFDDNRLRLTAEVAHKWGGFSATGELLYSRFWPAADTAGSLAARLPAVHGLGAYLQLGYFVVPRLLEVAGRMDYADHDLEIAGQTIHPAVGLNLYLAGHQLKAQAMYRFNIAIDDPYPDGNPLQTADTHEVVLGLQLMI